VVAGGLAFVLSERGPEGDALGRDLPDVSDRGLVAAL
jgi:hypothetical protein